MQLARTVCWRLVLANAGIGTVGSACRIRAYAEMLWPGGPPRQGVLWAAWLTLSVGTSVPLARTTHDAATSGEVVVAARQKPRLRSGNCFDGVGGGGFARGLGGCGFTLGVIGFTCGGDGSSGGGALGEASLAASAVGPGWLVGAGVAVATTLAAGGLGGAASLSACSAR